MNRQDIERLPRFGVVDGVIAPHPKGTMVRLDDVLATPDRADLRAALTNALAILDQRGGYGWTDAANILRDALTTPDRAAPSEGAEEHCCNDPEHMSPEYLAALRDHSDSATDLPCTCRPLFAGHVIDHPDCPRGRAERLDHGKPIDPDATPDRADRPLRCTNCGALAVWAEGEQTHIFDRATPDRADLPTEDEVFAVLSTDNPRSRQHNEEDGRTRSMWRCIPIRDVVEMQARFLAAPDRADHSDSGNIERAVRWYFSTSDDLTLAHILSAYERTRVSTPRTETPE